MATKWLVIGLILLVSAGAQENKKNATAKSQVISARTDQTGQHPGTAAISGPAKITCTSANSNTQNPQPKPSCFVQAPGFTGNLNVSQSAGASGAGTVILNCNGQGDVLTCSARID
jgi:hypothetical protein